MREAGRSGDGGEVSKILNAALYAAKKHSGQKRKDDVTPYINHPLEVAALLADVGGVTDEDLLVAALLHDVVEDTPTEPEEIASIFGAAVRGYVAEVTDDKSLPKEERKRLQIEHAPSLSKGAKQIRLADKISNIRDLTNAPPKDWSCDRKVEYFVWANRVFEGLRGANRELEDLFLEEHEEGERKVRSCAKVADS
jgi:guanosine-3',5'-bis(diphosphate) 3'-pyrophosphohydrolase